MKQALHIFQKDLRGIRVPLLLLYVVMAVQTAVTLRDPLTHDPVPGLQWFALLVPVTLLVTAGMLVQLEPLVGTTAFWMTKPIARGSLLVAKILFFLVFLVVPVALVTVAIALAYGIEPALMARAVGQSIVPLGSVLAGAMLLAAITPNFPAYLTLGIGFSLANQLLDSLVEKMVPIVYTPVNSTVQAAIVVISGVLLILHQYFTRRTRRTVVGLVLACLATSLAPRFWPWNLVDRPDLTLSAEGVVLALNAATPSGVFQASPRLGGGVSVTATPEVLDAPAGRDISMFVEGELRIDQGKRVPFDGVAGVLDSGGIEAAMPGFRWLGKRQPNPAELTVARRGEASFDELAGKPATLRGTISGQFHTYRVAGALPLTAGARLENRELGAVVQRVLRGPHSAQIELRIRQVEILGGAQLPRFLLVNRRREEMLEVDGESTGSLAGVSSLLGTTILRAWRTTLAFHSSKHGAPLDIDEEWLSGAELAVLEWVPAGNFQTQVEISDFRISDAPFIQRETSSGATQ
jgi:hypothetical protein